MFINYLSSEWIQSFSSYILFSNWRQVLNVVIQLHCWLIFLNRGVGFFFYPENFYIITQWSCSASGSLLEMPDSNPGPLFLEVWCATGEPPRHPHPYIVCCRDEALRRMCTTTRTPSSTSGRFITVSTLGFKVTNVFLGLGWGWLMDCASSLHFICRVTVSTGKHIN